MRLTAWFLAAVLYVAFWLSLATLASVVFRRAATAALVVIAFWLILTFFGSQIVSLVANIISPVTTDSTATQQLANAQLAAELGRLSPITLFTEMTQALLNPLVQSLDPVSPGSDRPAAADAAALRPEPAAGLAPGGDAGGRHGHLLCRRLCLVHAPGGSRVGRPSALHRSSTAGVPGGPRRRSVCGRVRVRPAASRPGASRASAQANRAARRRPISPPRKAVLVTSVTACPMATPMTTCMSPSRSMARTVRPTSALTTSRTRTANPRAPGSDSASALAGASISANSRFGRLPNSDAS